MLPANGKTTTDKLKTSTKFSISCTDKDAPLSAPFDASAEVKIFLKKPDVTLYISRPGEDCLALKQKNVQVLKGSTARLCWIVTTTDVEQK
mgnify:FL=1